MRHRYIFLDGLRGVAALAVLIVHLLIPFGLTAYVPNTHLAVDFFFILSGFVIAYAYEHKLLAGLSAPKFIKIRLVRLYPLFALGTLMGSAEVLGRVFSKGDIQLSDAIMRTVMALLFIPSGQWPGMHGLFPLNNPSWSLFYELIANIVYAAFVLRLKNRHLAVVIVLFGISLFCSSFYFGRIGGGSPDEVWSGVSRVGFGFPCGILIWRLRAHIPVAPTRWALPLVLVLAAVLFSPFAPYPGPGQAIVVMTIMPVLVALSSTIKLSGALASIAAKLGELSYPVYILHFPLVKLAGFIDRSPVSGEVGGALTIILISGAAAVLVATLAIPIDLRMRRWLSEIFVAPAERSGSQPLPKSGKDSRALF